MRIDCRMPIRGDRDHRSLPGANIKRRNSLSSRWIEYRGHEAKVKETFGL